MKINSIIFQRSLVFVVLLLVLVFATASDAFATVTKTYYPSGNLKSITYSPAQYNMLYEEFLDEEFFGTGLGRVSKRIKELPDGDGCLSYTYVYYPGSSRYQQMNSYSDSNWTTLKATSVYYNNLNARLEYKTYTQADPSGSIYYHYLDENWQSLGFGRVDKDKRAVIGPDGALSHSYSYHTSGLMARTTGYVDANWTTVCYYFDFYNNANNRLASRTLASADSNGNIYYHYLDEYFANAAGARIDKSKRLFVDNEGCLAFNYTYYAGTERIAVKQAYADSAWTTIRLTYAYYNDAYNRIATKTYASADISGNIYYHYLNENWLGMGIGRVDRAKRATVLNGELSSAYTYYADATGRLQLKKVYSDAYWTTLVSTQTFYNNASNRRSSMTLVTADASGNIYYAYLDESLGRVYMTKRRTANSEGCISFSYIYYSLTSRLQKVTGYSDPNWTTIKTTTVYYDNANNRMASKTYATADPSGNVYYHYLDENWLNTGLGRVDKARRAIAANGELSFSYTYYGDSNGRLYIKRCYSDANWGSLSSSLAFYNDAANRLSSKTLNGADQAGNVYYHYMNESFGGSANGRIDKSKRQVADNEGCISFRYTYFTYTDRISTKKGYSDSAWTTQKLTYTYYNNAASHMQCKIYVAADASGNIFYRYMDEGFYGSDNASTPVDERYGRVSKAFRAVTDADGAIGYEYEYYAGTGTVKTKRCYSTMSLADPLNPVFSGLVATYEYDVNGQLIPKAKEKEYVYDSSGKLAETIEFYATSGRIKQKTVYHTPGAAYPFTVCGYYDESFYQDGNGRRSSQYSNYGGGPSGMSATYYLEYHAGTDKVKVYEIRTGSSWTYRCTVNVSGLLTERKETSAGDLKMTYTYYQNSSNRVATKLYTAPDQNGILFYEYMDEGFYGSDYSSTPVDEGYGRVSRAYGATADADGAKGYEYEYHIGTGTVKIKRCYSGVDIANNPLKPVLSGLAATYEYDINGQLVRKIIGDQLTTTANEVLSLQNALTTQTDQFTGTGVKDDVVTAGSLQN